MTSRNSVFNSARNPRVAIALIVAMFCPASAFAQQPRGGQVVQGSATIATPTTSTTTITQSSQRAIIDWQDFSIGAGGVVNIQQPGSAAALLNRVTGGQLSVINGQLQANGRVYLINPQGIVVGPNGVIDTAAFIGSTLNTSNEAFMSGGPLTFAGDSKAGVINLGTIRTAQGDVVIIAATIANGGSLLAEAGTAALLSGSEVLYAPGGDSPFLIKAPVDSGDGAAIENSGVIRAAEAVLKSAGSAYAIAVNGGGEISATSVNKSGGRILIESDGDITLGAGTTLRANAVGQGDGGSIVIKSGAATTFEGQIEAKGGAQAGDGGFAEVSGRDVTFAGSVNLTAAEGRTGTLLIDPVTVNIDAPTAASIATNLDTANFEVQADNDINVNAPIVNETTTNTLTLNAPIVAVNENITIPSGVLELDSSINDAISVTSDASATISASSIYVWGGYQNVNFAGALLVDNSVSFNPSVPTVESFVAANSANEISNLYLTDGEVIVTGDVDVRSSTTMSVAFSLTATGNLTLVSGGDLVFENDTPATFNVDGLTRLAAAGSVLNLGNELVLGGAGRKLIYHSDTGETNIGLGYTEVIGVAFPSDTLGSGNVIYIDDGSVLPLLTLTADGKTMMYGDPEPAFTVSFTGGSASDLTGAVQFRFDVPHSDVGVYTIIPYGASSASHQLEYVSGTLRVTPAPLLISGPTVSSIYGSALPAFTPIFSGLRGLDQPSEISGLVLTTSATPQSSVGTYAIVPSGAVNANYTITYANGSFSITPATLRIIANNASRLYGAADPLFSGSFSGLLNGDTASVVSGLSFLTSATEGSSVGNYQIVGSGGSAQNYEIQYVPGTLSVTPAPLSVWTTNALVTYGDALPVLTNTVTGLVAGDTVSSLGLSATSAYVQGAGVGQYFTTLLNSPANYQVTYTPGMITVSPRSLFIIANDATRFRLEANPVFTANVSGLFGADQANGLSFSTVASPSSAAGNYAIVPSVGAMPNYDVHLVNGTLAVQQPPITLTFGVDPEEALKDIKNSLPDITMPVNDVRVFFAGTGMSAMLNNSPGVITRVLSAYEGTVKDAQGSGPTLRYLMAHNLSGENNEVGKLLPFLVGEAKDILDRDPSTWSAEEAKFITYMTDVIGQQRKDAVENAAAQLADWKRQQQAVADSQGLGSLIAVQGVPPDTFLQQAQSGISTDYEASGTYAGLITAAAGTVLVTGGALAVAYGVGTTAVVHAVIPFAITAAAASHTASVAASLAAGETVAVTTAGTVGLGASAILAGVLVVAVMITAGVVAAVNVANARDYDKKMGEAVAAAQKPMTAADLKAMLAGEDGQKTAYLSLVGQVAKNAADKKAMGGQ